MPPVAMSLALYLLCTVPTGKALVTICKVAVPGVADLEPKVDEGLAGVKPVQPARQAITRGRIMTQRIATSTEKRSTFLLSLTVQG